MKPTAGVSHEAQMIHEQSLVIDLHADTLFLVFMIGYQLKKRHRNPFPSSPFIGHVDIPRLREGGVTAIGLTVPSLPLNIARRGGRIRRTLKKVNDWAERIQPNLMMARSSDDILRAREQGVPAFFLTLEGAHGVTNRMKEMTEYRQSGLLSITLAHLVRCAAAYPSTFGRWKNERLPNRGHELIEKMERAGIIVDLAHMASRSFIDAVESCTRPPIVSHTGLTGVRSMWRNISDYEAKRVAEKNGVIGIIFYPGFLSTSRRGSLDCVMSNIHYLLKLVGDDYIALGSDFDGWVPAMPSDLRDVSELPRLTERMLHDGIPVDSIKKILGRNALRVIKEVCG
jgi:membrane dipeptidase